MCAPGKHLESFPYQHRHWGRYQRRRLYLILPQPTLSDRRAKPAVINPQGVLRSCKRLRVRVVDGKQPRRAKVTGQLDDSGERIVLGGDEQTCIDVFQWS